MLYRKITTAERPGAPADLATLRALALAEDGRLALVGETLAGAPVMVLGAADRRPARRCALGRPGWSVAFDAEGRLWVGQDDQVEVLSAEGEPSEVWGERDRFGLITAIGFAGADVFLADARARCIHRCDLNGRHLNDVGDRHRKGGFHIPNGVVDFAVDRDATLVVANPGLHRVERWSAAGELLSRFGRFDQHDPAGFPGCCNPTNLALGPRGEIVVSEKAPPRVKVYDPSGELLAVVAAGDAFEPTAKNMDLAVDAEGRIAVIDPARRQVSIFERVAQEVAA